jgi:hypothetical protein
VGSNPSPGAYFEEPSISLKALAGESRVEVATTNMDELTESETKQKKQKMMITTTTTTDTSKSHSGRSQASSSSFLQERDKIIATVDGAGVADGATSPVKNLSHYRLHRHS